LPSAVTPLAEEVEREEDDTDERREEEVEEEDDCFAGAASFPSKNFAVGFLVSAV